MIRCARYRSSFLAIDARAEPFSKATQGDAASAATGHAGFAVSQARPDCVPALRDPGSKHIKEVTKIDGNDSARGPGGGSGVGGLAFMGLRMWQLILCLVLGFLWPLRAAPEINNVITGIVRAAHRPLNSPHSNGGDAPVPETPTTRTVNLLEVSTRAKHAHQIITGFALATPALAGLWHQVNDALSDVPVLTTEITRLGAWLTACRVNRANLAAAGRLTIAAYHNGEHRPTRLPAGRVARPGLRAGRGDA